MALEIVNKDIQLCHFASKHASFSMTLPGTITFTNKDASMTSCSTRACHWYPEPGTSTSLNIGAFGQRPVSVHGLSHSCPPSPKPFSLSSSWLQFVPTSQC